MNFQNMYVQNKYQLIKKLKRKLLFLYRYQKKKGQIKNDCKSNYLETKLYSVQYVCKINYLNRVRNTDAWALHVRQLPKCSNWHYTRAVHIIYL